jgi:hypothetical protein
VPPVKDPDRPVIRGPVNFCKNNGVGGIESDDAPGHLDELLGRRWIGGLFLLAAFVLPLLRQRGTASWQTLWPEDGYVYTDQAIKGGLGSVGRGYGGYLQLSPRLLAIPTPYFSLKYLALYSTLAAAFVGALLAWSVYHLSRGWVSSRLVRLVLASFVVLMPSLGWEITGSTTNTIWVFLAVLPWALVSLEDTPWDVTLRAVIAFLGATASALSLLFIPLSLGWLAYRRTRSTLIVAGSYFLGAAIQVGVSLASGEPTSHHPVVRSASQLGADLGSRFFGVFLLGPQWEADLSHSGWRWVVVYLAPLLVLAMLALAARGAGRRAQVMAGAFIALAVVLYVVPVWGRGTNGTAMFRDIYFDQRFDVVPVMLLASAFAVLIAPTSCSTRRFVTRIARPSFVVLAAVLSVVGFSVTTIRSTDPPWTTRVERVQADQCAGRPSSTVAIIPNATLDLLSPLPIPKGAYPLTVRCSNIG